jgi:glycosyltransferase involved in cell wall biosynthesis
MKVVMLSTDYLPNIGGIAAHIYHLSNALNKLGIEVVVLNPVKGTLYSVEKVLDGNVLRYLVTFPSKRNRVLRVWSRTRSILHALEFIENDFGKFDILHQHDHMNSTFASNYYKGNAKWIWTNHTSGFLKDMDKKIKKNIIKFSYKGVKRIITASKERERITHELFGEDMTVDYIPNGVDIETFNPDINVKREDYSLNNDDCVVLCPSRMVEVKGVIYLAKAVERLMKEKQDVKWKFLFVGSEPSYNTDQSYIEEVKKVLDSAHEIGCIKYLGNVSIDKMPMLYSISDIVVMPSLMEAVSLSALETMSIGKPLIATNIGGFPDIITNNETGILVPPRDPESIVEALLLLSRNNKLAENISKNSKELVLKNYSWEKIAKRTLSIYKELISTNN